MFTEMDRAMSGFGSYSEGWGNDDDYDEYDSDGGSGGGLTDNERLFRFRFSIPTPKGTAKKPNLVNPGRSATKRVMFLRGKPFCLYEHSLWSFKSSYSVLNSYTAICLAKNKLTPKGCPLCAKDGGDSFASFVGMFPVIDMGQVEYAGGNVQLHHETWTNSKGEVQERRFNKMLLGAKRGSQDKPGVLKRLQFQMNRLQEKHGYKDLTGTVWDTTRTGEKDPVVGDAWEFVEKIEEDRFEDYLVGLGANREYLDLSIPVYHDEDTNDGVFDVDPDVYYNKLAKVVGWGAGGDNGERKASTVSGAGFEGGQQAPGDDDIPF